MKRDEHTEAHDAVAGELPEAATVADDGDAPRPSGWFVRVGTGLLGAAVCALVSYGVTHSMTDTWSVVSESTVTHEFPAGATVVGAVGSEGVSVVDMDRSERLARGAQPRLVFTRRCLLPVAADVQSRPVAGPPPGSAMVDVAPAPWWARCSGRGKWFVPPETGVQVSAYDGSFEFVSRDQAARTAAQDRKDALQAQVEALAVQQQRLKAQQEKLRAAQARVARAQAEAAARAQKTRAASAP